VAGSSLLLFEAVVEMEVPEPSITNCVGDSPSPSSCFSGLAALDVAVMGAMSEESELLLEWTKPSRLDSRRLFLIDCFSGEDVKIASCIGRTSASGVLILLPLATAAVTAREMHKEAAVRLRVGFIIISQWSMADDDVCLCFNVHDFQ
jgi:hypothetical protein